MRYPLAAGFVNLGCGPKKDLTGIHQCLAKRWVGVNGFNDISHFAAHFNGQDRLCDKFSGPGADDTATDNTTAFGIDEPLGETVSSSIGDRPSTGGPWVHCYFVGNSLFLFVFCDQVLASASQMPAAGALVRAARYSSCCAC